MQTWKTLAFILMLIAAPVGVCEPSKAISKCLPDCAKDCGPEMGQQNTRDLASCCHSQATAILVADMKEDSAQPQAFFQAVSHASQNPSRFSLHQLPPSVSGSDSDQGKNLAKFSLLRI
ncbi:MAG TPA: hypothetical protein VLH08_01915 [Acidobacteriota bacterium]|nr:hypothetical protein [Acidobacteriota bacterium]